MKNQFVLNLDPVSATGTVLLNDCGISSQSQLRICSTDNFFNWYKELPTMLFSEVNDSCEEMEKRAQWLSELSRGPERIYLLPYHDMGISKLVSLDMDTKTMASFGTPSPEHLEELKEILERRGWDVYIG